MSSTTYNQTDKRFIDNIRSIGLLGKLPWIGVIMFLLGTLAFAGFAWNVEANGPLTYMDQVVGNNLHLVAKQSSVFIIDLMIFGSFMGRELVVLLTVALALYFIYKRFWREFWMVAIGLGGGEVMFESLSRLFNRHRPVFPSQVWETLPGPGFPSGHCISAVLMYGFLAYILVPKMPNRFWKAIVILVALLIMAYIGFSRVFVGDHYLTDVLAGYSIGLAWAGIVYTSVEVFFHRRQEHKSERHIITKK